MHKGLKRNMIIVDPPIKNRFKNWFCLKKSIWLQNYIFTKNIAKNCRMYVNM